MNSNYVSDYAFENCANLTDLTISSYTNYINKDAFAGCSRLKRIKCMATEPPYMYDEDCFESICYRNATLQVPASSVERYRGIYPWSRFYNIIGYNETAGDVNADGEVNIADINAVIDQILSANYTESGDVNGDHEVNIADINAIIDMILSH